MKRLSKALKRLEQSNTYLKRRNARLEFKRAVAALTKTVDSAYPAMRRDGSAITRRKPRGAWCPICQVPMVSFKKLACHLRVAHGWYQCSCGKHYTRFGDFAKHLAGIGDLATHFVISAMARSSGGVT